jgi:hypothetical protein
MVNLYQKRPSTFSQNSEDVPLMQIKVAYLINAEFLSGGHVNEYTLVYQTGCDKLATGQNEPSGAE